MSFSTKLLVSFLSIAYVIAYCADRTKVRNNQLTVVRSV